MIKVEALENFTLREYDKITDMERKGIDNKGYVYRGDIFKCDEAMCEYLCGKNPLNRPVVKVIEVITEKEPVKEVEPIEKKEVVIPKKPSKKKTSKK